MNKYLVILSAFLFLSCELSEIKSKNKTVPNNFQTDFYENIIGVYDVNFSKSYR